MRKFFLIIALTAATALLPPRTEAQLPPAGYEYADSVIFIPVAQVDSSLKGKDIFAVLPDNVTVVQSGAIRSLVETRTRTNDGKMQSGFRVRIFFDNSQSTRGASSAALCRFKLKYPEIPAYRSFTSPYFKVTVGDYRNKSEALAALSEIRKDFPTAFIVRERFKYPMMDDVAAFKLDTVRVLKPISK